MISGARHEARAALRGVATTMLGGLARVLTVAAEGARMAARQLDLPAREPDREPARPSSVRDAVDDLPGEPVRVAPPLFDDDPWDEPAPATPASDPWDERAPLTPASDPWDEPAPGAVTDRRASTPGDRAPDPWAPAPDEPVVPPEEARRSASQLAPEGPGPVPVDVVERAGSLEPVDPTEPADPAEPVDPTEPVEPTEPVDVGEPVEPTEAEPVEPLGPDPRIVEIGERNVREVLATLRHLSQEELRALETYERAHKRRKTVLGAIERATFR